MNSLYHLGMKKIQNGNEYFKKIMTKVFKVFIATSSFSEDLSNANRIKGNRKFKIIKNPTQKKLTGDQIIKYAKDCEYIIAGTENYSKEIINNLTNLKYLFRHFAYIYVVLLSFRLLSSW